jgi:pimeloyl-ACP methyl ester carboxylesterase
MQPPAAAAWQTIPTTVIIGQDDQLVSQEERHRAIDSVKDVRLLNSDHFILWRQPEALSQAVLEALPHNWARADE